MRNKMYFGYPSTEPCIVCGGYKNNQMESRFCYVVCEDHQDVSPTEIKTAREEEGIK